MSIIVGKETKLVVQGATGREGSFHTLRNRGYGTDVVAGVTPGKGGSDLEGIPIFDTVAEMARVSNGLVVIEDTLFSSERQEQAEKLRDPTHVRNYTEDEWADYLTAAGLEVEQAECFEKTHPLEAWLARTGCEGAEAERVKELLADRMTEDGRAWTDTKIVIRARRSQS